MGKATLTIVLVYSPAPRQVVEKTLTIPEGSTVLAALQAGQCLDAAVEPTHALGIWGKKTSLTHVLHDLDRLEVYRPLKVDPKVARRERFQSQGARTTGLFAKQRTGAKAGY